MVRRKNSRQKHARKVERENRDSALTDAERIKQANRKLTRKMRADKKAAEELAEKKRVEAEAERKRKEEHDKMEKVASLRVINAAKFLNTPKIKKKTTRPSMQTSGKESAIARLLSTNTEDDVPQTVRELTSCGFVTRVLPTREDIEMSASCCVMSSNVEEGVCFWPNEMGEFSRPDAWEDVIVFIESYYMKALEDGRSNDIDDDLIQIKHGEYNLVATIKQPNKLRELGVELPDMDYERVVLRITRPDGGETNGKTLSMMRYKRRSVIQRELYFQLHASCNGIGLPCEAAFLYPGSIAHSDGTQLYGGFYVLQKAYKDMNRLIQEHTERLEAMPSANQRDAEQRLAGQRLAARTLKLVNHASALGLVAADMKPGNIVFDESGTAFIIDFDGCMNTIMHPGTSYAPHVLHNMTLLTAHVRGFREPTLADGWADAIKPLMIDLVAASRGCKWLGDAKPGKKAYAELPNDLEQTCTHRIEFVSTSYFLRSRMAPFNFVLGENAPPLIVQLVRFGLFGVTGAHERDLIWNTWSPTAPAWG